MIDFETLITIITISINGGVVVGIFFEILFWDTIELQRKFRLHRLGREEDN